MKLDELTFGTLREVEPNLVEITAKQGIKVSKEHIEQIEEALLTKYEGAYAILINRVNSYSHTHDSMVKIAQLRNLTAIAIIVYSDMSEQTAQIHGHYQENVQVFVSKDRAITWLRNSITKRVC